MKNWISQMGIHVASVNRSGWPDVFVTESCSVDEASDNSTIAFQLDNKQLQIMKANLALHPWVAVAPGQLGAVRAPYQFKGQARIEENFVKVDVMEIYCTKPGDEAGFRLDTIDYDQMLQFETSRWPDLNPPGIND